MALTTKFLRALDKLVEHRTEELRRLVVRGKQGRPKEFSRKRRDALKDDLLHTAIDILVRKHAKKEFYKVTYNPHYRHINGRGHAQRFENIESWAERKLDGPIVYVFWKGKKCLYVGRGANPGRLNQYQKSSYLFEASIIEVWPVTTLGQLPRAECLAIHLFRPRDNKQKAARVKWGKACQVCKLHDQISDEIGFLFRMRA